MKIILKESAKVQGVLDREQAARLISAGILSADDEARFESEKHWCSLGSLVALQTPPPVPCLAKMSVISGQPFVLGGWLLFFCSGLTVFGPLIVLSFQIGQSLDLLRLIPNSSPLRDMLIWDSISTLGLVVYGFRTGFMMLKGHPKGRSLAIRYLKVSTVLAASADFISFQLLSDRSSQLELVFKQQVTTALVKGWFWQLVWVGIWIAYFRTSKRVRETYGEE